MTAAQRYEVVRELGRGGMGAVYLARDRFLDRPVAIKRLLPGADATLRARFLEEAQVTGQLAHPNIVTVHELGGEGQDVFLVMKLVAGKTLQEVVADLRRGEPVTVAAYGRRRLLRLFLGVCEAVAYAHGRGVIHRDLKPANIMLGAGDEVLVMDWGLAKPVGAPDETSPGASQSQLVHSVVRSGSQVGSFADLDPGASGDLTRAGTVVGTPAYMPPEQANMGADLDPRADVYSLGAILYELLAGQPAFQGNGMQVLMRLVREAPPRPREVAPDLPPVLEAIVLRAMARERDERYPDAAALASDLERYLDGRSVEAYRERPLEAARRLLGRHRVAVVTAALSFVLVNVLVLGAAKLVLDEEARLQEDARTAASAAEEARTAASEATAARAGIAPVARALELAGEAARVAAGFAAEARTLLPLDAPGAAGSPEDEAQAPAPGLLDAHGAARAALAGLAEQVQALEAEPEQLAPFVDEVGAARRGVDRALADALLARKPQLLLDAVGPDLDLGPERPLDLARAHLRLGDRAAAREALATAGPWPEERTDLATAAAALRALLEDAPLAQQEPLFDAALAQAPTRAWLHLRRAEVRARRGDFAGAEADYARAARLHVLDGWIHTSRVLTTYPVFADYRLTQRLYEVIRLLSPGNPEGEVVRSRTNLWPFGKWERTEQVLAEIAAERPRLALAWRADSALVLERLEEAEAAARELLEADPEHRVGLGCLAEAHLLRGALEEAGALAERGLDRYPEDGRLNHVRGRALALVGRHREALPFLERGARPARASDPWRHLAESLAALDDPAGWDRGVEAARRALALDPAAAFSYSPSARPVLLDPRPHRVLGDLYRRQERPAAAALHYVRAYLLAQFDRTGQALGRTARDAFAAAECHEELGLTAEAAQLYARALDDPEVGAEARRRMERLGWSPR